MSTIKLETSDSKIWNVDRKSAEITAACLRSETVTIDLNYEGPCAENIGLYALLDHIVGLVGMEKSDVFIDTWNQLESHNEYMIRRHSCDKGVIDLQKKLKQNPPKQKVIDSNTKIFGNFVGHGNRLRLALAAHLYTRHHDKSLQSYHTDFTNEYFREFLGLEDLLFHRYDLSTVTAAMQLLEAAPLKLDDITEYPILFHKNKVYNILDYYDNIFIDLVNQTYCNGSTFFLDDKFWRSIITKTPFIVQGPRHFLTNLKVLGFKTFDQWWDEGYSEDPPDFQIKLIMQEIDKISNWSTDKIKAVYQEMMPVLEHNYKRFLSLTVGDFYQAFDYLPNHRKI